MGEIEGEEEGVEEEMRVEVLGKEDGAGLTRCEFWCSGVFSISASFFGLLSEG